MLGKVDLKEADGQNFQVWPGAGPASTNGLCEHASLYMLDHPVKITPKPKQSQPVSRSKDLRAVAREKIGSRPGVWTCLCNLSSVGGPELKIPSSGECGAARQTLVARKSGAQVPRHATSAEVVQANAALPVS